MGFSFFVVVSSEFSFEKGDAVETETKLILTLMVSKYLRLRV